MSSFQSQSMDFPSPPPGRELSQSVSITSFNGRNETKRLSFMKADDIQTAVKGNLYSSNTPQNLMLPQQFNFVTEADFKKSNECYVCKVPFGSLKDRQHHCRLCGHSCCSLCSSRTINQNRACDVCFLRATQITYEKKRRRYIKAMKDHIEKMNIHLKAGDEKLKELDREEVAQKEQIETETEKLKREAEELLKLQQAQEREKQDLSTQLKQLQQMIDPKKQLQDKLQQEEHECDQRLRQLDAEIFLKQQVLEEKKQQYERLKQNLQDLEKSESFLNLSHYQDAYNKDPNHVAETLLSMDKQKKENKQSFTSSTNSQHRAQQLYDPTYFDRQQLEDIMNAGDPIYQKHKVRSDGKSKKKEEQDTSGCNEKCSIF